VNHHLEGGIRKKHFFRSFTHAFRKRRGGAVTKISRVTKVGDLREEWKGIVFSCVAEVLRGRGESRPHLDDLERNSRLRAAVGGRVAVAAPEPGRVDL